MSNWTGLGIGTKNSDGEQDVMKFTKPPFTQFGRRKKRTEEASALPPATRQKRLQYRKYSKTK